MRPIKFRGMTLEGEWVYGSLILGNEDLDKPQPAFISTFVKDEISFSILPVKVNRYSIGQFTGLKDKNGKEIYEGDVVTLEDLGIAREHKFIVVYDYFNASFKFREKYSLVMQNSKCEIIGNIYDNPELTISKETKDR